MAIVTARWRAVLDPADVRAEGSRRLRAWPAALETLLAVTVYCVGCRLYFLRWWVPSLFDRIARRTTFGT